MKTDEGELVFECAVVNPGERVALYAQCEEGHFQGERFECEKEIAQHFVLADIHMGRVRQMVGRNRGMPFQVATMMPLIVMNTLSLGEDAEMVVVNTSDQPQAFKAKVAGRMIREPEGAARLKAMREDMENHIRSRMVSK